ncbi:MAG: DNA mismatch endonuclease Vsr [Bacilli bacterium]|nr:DNA mismatch endonuclease Vsr [Bacilli bacterium]
MARDKETIHRTMSAIRGKDTGIEKKLRKALTEKGIRYRLYSSKVIGHPDILLPRERIAIFADSEFWHGYHYEENIEKVKTNREFWVNKIKRNMARDEEVNRVLKEQGYLVLRYWGFEIEKELDRVIGEILSKIRERKAIFDAISSIKKKDHTTLGYLFREDEMLLLYRNKKEHDVNEGKYIGMGGHIEPGETPLQCIKREIKEESGLNLKKARYLGKLDFINSKCDPERIYVYKGLDYDGEMKECDEGELTYVKISKAMDLPMWEGDRLFFPLLLDDRPKKPFHLIVVYDGSTLLYSIGPIYNEEKNKKKKSKKKAGKRR